jgi:hypothetical protein
VQTHLTFALAMPHCMQTRVIVSYLHFDVDAHLVPSHTCCVIYLQSDDRRKLAMLTTCRLVIVSHLCYLPAVARPSQTCYASYMQEHDRLTLVMLPTCRPVAVSNFLFYLYADSRAYFPISFTSYAMFIFR